MNLKVYIQSEKSDSINLIVYDDDIGVPDMLDSEPIPPTVNAQAIFERYQAFGKSMYGPSYEKLHLCYIKVMKEEASRFEFDNEHIYNKEELEFILKAEAAAEAKLLYR